MSSTTWTPRAVASEARRCKLEAWRAVEAQHIASTTRLVDSIAEQETLEQILDAFKPPQPPSAARLDYLLATPFRYPPWQRGSRFRSPTDPGVFYGAEEKRAACAELGYWRWRFVADSRGLDSLGPAPHTLFQVKLDAQCVDLRAKPFSRNAAAWIDPIDYRATQAFASAARKAPVSLIRYQSVRDPQKGGCVAVLEPRAFARPRPVATQNWLLSVNRGRTTWQRDAEHFEFVWS